MQIKHSRKEGQAIIFLMVVVVIGLFVVIWNFDLHRIITAKIRVRNAADAAAMAAARWQGVTLNMIGDLNLVQAALLAEEAEAQALDPVFDLSSIAVQLSDLHELRNRLAFYGPLAAYSIAQQVAFDNGAFRDPRLEGDLLWIADIIRRQVNAPPFDNAFKDYAFLLEDIVAHGAAIGSYSVRFPEDDNPLNQEKFYAGIAMALAGLWCGLEDYEYELEMYENFESWSKLEMDESILFYMLDLKLATWASAREGPYTPPRRMPPTALTGDKSEVSDYINADTRGILANIMSASTNANSATNFITEGIFPSKEVENGDIRWHIYNAAWQRQWPQPREGEDDLEDDEDMDYFPIWGDIQDKYNYLGAEAGFTISAPVHRGILTDSSRKTVDLDYQAKAMPFGYIEARGQDSPPNYLGFVFPVFSDVRLIHSDIGDDQLPPEFFRHVFSHLEPYMDNGPEALNPNCEYCRLLEAWDNLDRREGLRWLDRAGEMEDNPCDPDDDGSEWQGLRGGATRGS